MQTPPFQDRPPESDKVTPYDEMHFVTYLRLLDGDAAGVDWREMVRVLVGLDLGQGDRARLVYDSHLARARWMTEQGYRQLLR